MQPTDRAPTDMELMMLLDGELDGDRRAEVEAFLAEAGAFEGDAARGKVAGMRAVGAVVATLDWSAAAPLASSIDVADVVMAAIGKSAVHPQLAAPRVAEPAAAVTAPFAASPTAGASARPLRRGPANDNSRSIFGFAIAAAAAAAVLFFWGKSGDEPAVGPSPVAMSAPPVDPGDAAPIPTNEVASALAADLKNDPADEPRYGVEVASVDFGTRTGAIYYVPAVDLDDVASKAAVTTVVWLNDD